MKMRKFLCFHANSNTFPRKICLVLRPLNHNGNGSIVIHKTCIEPLCRKLGMGLEQQVLWLHFTPDHPTSSKWIGRHFILSYKQQLGLYVSF